MRKLTRVDGLVDFVGPVQTFKNDFKKRELWLCLHGETERPQFVCLEATFEMIEELEDFSAGDPVVAHYALGGRKWENPSGDSRCFNTLSLRKIQTLADRDTHQDEAEGMPF